MEERVRRTRVRKIGGMNLKGKGRNERCRREEKGIWERRRMRRK